MPLIALDDQHDNLIAIAEDGMLFWSCDYPALTRDADRAAQTCVFLSVGLPMTQLSVENGRCIFVTEVSRE